MNQPNNNDSHSKNALRAWLQLLKFAKRMEQRANSRFAAEHQCSLSRFDVLANLDLNPHGRASTSQLAQMLLASKGNITRLLDRMEVDDLLERQPNDQDKRVSDVVMNENGKRLFQQMAHDHEVWTDEVFNVLSNEEIKVLIQLVSKLRDRLEQPVHTDD